VRCKWCKSVNTGCYCFNCVGALAGIADQPLQVFTRAHTGDCATVSGTATGLVSGISKGLIGVVTKPIGGAAEFVSQTSLGLLHHVGVMGDCLHMHQSVELPLSSFRNSPSKYHELVFMAALHSRCGHYTFVLFILSSFFFFSSPNLSDCGLDVYHTSTHSVALVRI